MKASQRVTRRILATGTRRSLGVADMYPALSQFSSSGVHSTKVQTPKYNKQTLQKGLPKQYLGAPAGHKSMLRAIAAETLMRCAAG
jgi:hypothetical protein